jgi:hypothetical protein
MHAPPPPHPHPPLSRKLVDYFLSLFLLSLFLL